MRRLLCFLFLFCLSVPAFSQAKISFSSVVVFGDSLSDTGQFYNTTLALGIGYPSPQFGYTTARFTDGADSTPAAHAHFGVWHEQLNDMLPGMPIAQPALKGGTNYAFGDATTADGITNVPVTAGVNIPVRNMGQQVTDYLGSNKPSSTALFVIWGGANDYLQNSSADPAAVAANIAKLVSRLMTAGAVNFLVLNEPPTSNDQAATNYALALRTDLANLLSPYAGQANFYELDIFSAFGAISANPSAYGFTNLTAAANTLGAGVNPDTYLLWDGLHPTTAGHFWVANAVCSTLTRSSVQLATNGNTLVATVQQLQGATVPSGSVQFYSDTFANGVPTHTLLGSAPLNASGVASLASSQIPAGTYTVSAVYSGDSVFPQGCRSQSVAFTSATAAAFTLSLSPAATSVNTGSPASTQVSVVPTGGFAQNVTISCGTALPQYASCFVTNSTVTLNGTTSSVATVTLQTQTTISVSNTKGPIERPGPPLVLFALTPLALLALRRRAWAGRVLAALLLMITLTAAGGCGGSETSVGISAKTYNVAPGNYTIPITGKAADGTTVTRNWSVTLI